MPEKEKERRTHSVELGAPELKLTAISGVSDDGCMVNGLDSV